MVEDYKYLDEERVKLWAELRETQEKLQSLMDIASQTEDGGQRALISIGTKAARAYHRLLAREKEISDFVERGEATWSRVVSCEKEAIAKSANVRQAAEAVDSAHKLIDQHLSAAELRLNEASARAKSAEARLDAIEESLARSSEAASAYDKLNAEFKANKIGPLRTIRKLRNGIAYCLATRKMMALLLRASFVILRMSMVSLRQRLPRQKRMPKSLRKNMLSERRRF